MGRDLSEGSQAARALFETADTVLDYSVSKLCFEGPAEKLQLTLYAQPALFVTSLAALEAARAAGSLPGQPAFVAGHSLGEYTALAAAGAIEFTDGLRLVHERGRLMQEAAEAEPGGMAAILGLDAEAVAAVCEETGAEVCNLNAPGQTVIGGRTLAVEAATKLSLERGAQRAVPLRVNGGYHTSLMRPAVEAMRRAVEATPIRDPEVPIIANTSAQPLTNEADLREELVEQLARPVRWQQSVEYLAAQGIESVIEFGPGRVLTGLVRRINRSIAVRNVSDTASADGVAKSAPASP
jgi:[acyl-carrier-protein] S-malonyltransferase